MIRKYAEIFCWKNVKLLTFFSAKNIRILCIESTKTVNEMTLNKLVKLTTLWTTGPWCLCQCMTKPSIRCVTSKDSTQLVHPPSMARVLDSLETVEGTCGQGRLWSDSRMRRLIWVFADGKSFVGFVVCWLIFVFHINKRFSWRNKKTIT